MPKRFRTMAPLRAIQAATDSLDKKPNPIGGTDLPPFTGPHEPATARKPARSADPSLIESKHIIAEHIGYSRWNTRHASSFSDEEFQSLKADISRAGGNIQPVKVRRRIAAPDALSHAKVETYELVFGHRRHQACMQLGLPVLAIIEDVSDEQLIGEMLRENENRKTLAAWELGELFQRLLDEKRYPSQTALAQALARDEGDVSRALQVRAIPDDILAVIDTPTSFALHDGSKINKTLKTDRAAVIAVVDGLVSEARQVTAKEFMKLIAKKPEPRPKCPCEEIGGSKTDGIDVHLANDGKDIVRSLRHLDGTQTIQIMEAMSPEKQAFIGNMVASLVRAMALS